jgi:hypothetical protein
MTPAKPMEPGERADRLLPVAPHERDWPKCGHCGSEVIVIVGEWLCCETCSAILDEYEAPT